MSHVLLIHSSLFGDQSKSAQIAGEFVAAWRRAHPGALMTERELTPASMPHLSLDALGALMTAPEQRTAEQTKRVAFADRLIEELEAADTIVLAVPMYNFSIPSTLKAWIDHVARAGRTFRYTASGPEGLLKGKKVFAITARGGVYTGDSPARSLDFQEPYLRGVLAFLGLTEISFIHVEGLKVSPETAEKGIARARAAIAATIEAFAEAA
jgi:FMN-dependent NADH-azoreductase